jgi:imidazolonepropionase-like amidohydrolase
MSVIGAAAHAETLVVTNARLWTAAQAQPVDNATIVIKDGKVFTVGIGIKAPAHARVIDAKGRLVTPGLMNAGTQLGLVEVSSVGDTTDQAVTSGPLGAAFDVEYALNPNSMLLPRARADGLTRAATYPSGSANAPFAGAAAVLRLSEGPDILDRAKAAMVVVTGGVAAAQHDGSRSAQWILLRNALSEAKRYAQVAKGGPRDQLLNHLDAEALLPVVGGHEPLAVFASRESDIREAVKVGDDFGVRVIVFGGQEAWRCAGLLARKHVAVVLDPLDDQPATFDQMGARLDNAAILDRAGVTIAFSVPGIQLSHNAGTGMREAAGIAVANGLPWAQAMKAMTVNPAHIWNIEDHYGALAPGLDADLVIWDGDPLEPGSAPTTVLVRGQPVSLTTRQDLLRERYAPGHRADAWPPAYRQ